VAAAVATLCASMPLVAPSPMFRRLDLCTSVSFVSPSHVLMSCSATQRNWKPYRIPQGQRRAAMERGSNFSD
jgi:hypothetical protein